jgi:phosphoglycerate-specific signal transduction histidine kinase
MKIKNLTSVSHKINQPLNMLINIKISQCDLFDWASQE